MRWPHPRTLWMAVPQVPVKWLLQKADGMFPEGQRGPRPFAKDSAAAEKTNELLENAMWWPVVSICAHPQLPGLSAAMLPTDRAPPESAYFLLEINLRRVRRAAIRRCQWSRGSPAEAAVVSGGGDPRAASDASAAASKMRPWADGRPRLAARGVVAAGHAAARWTRLAPEMRIEPRIARGGGLDGHRRRSARALYARLLWRKKKSVNNCSHRP